MKSNAQACPFERIAEELTKRANELDPARASRPAAELIGALLANDRDDPLFHSLDLMPFSAARLDSIQ